MNISKVADFTNLMTLATEGILAGISDPGYIIQNRISRAKELLRENEDAVMDNVPREARKDTIRNAYLAARDAYSIAYTTLWNDRIGQHSTWTTDAIKQMDEEVKIG